MGPELKLGLNSRPSHEIAERRDSGYIRGIRGSVSSFRASPRKRDPAWRSLLRGRGVSLKGECVLRLPRFRRDFMRSRLGGLPAKSFYGKRGTTREVAHWCWRNELYDPLSSFVPELEPRRRRGFSFGSGPHRRKPQPLTESAPSPSAAGYCGRWLWARPRSGRVAGIEVGRSLQFALFRHHRGARAALLTSPAEPLLRDVVLARPAIFPSLTDEGLLANGLSHSLRLCELRGCA